MSSTITINTIGPTLRQARKAKSFTLKELSQLTGLSVAFISQVERGKTRPSLVSLLQICEKLDLEVRDVLDSGQQFELYRRGDEREVKSSGGGAGYISLSNPFSEQKLDPFVYIVPSGYVSQTQPGEGLDGEGFCYILSGSIDVQYMGSSYTLHATDSMHYDLSKTLLIANPYDTPARALWVTSVVLI